MQSVTHGRMDTRMHGQAQTNMPPQLLRSWGHKNKKFRNANNFGTKVIISFDLTKKIHTNTRCFHSQIKKLQAFEILKCHIPLFNVANGKLLSHQITWNVL